MQAAGQQRLVRPKGAHLPRRRQALRAGREAGQVQWAGDQRGMVKTRGRRPWASAGPERVGRVEEAEGQGQGESTRRQFVHAQGVRARRRG